MFNSKQKTKSGKSPDTVSVSSSRRKNKYPAGEEPSEEYLEAAFYPVLKKDRSCGHFVNYISHNRMIWGKW